MARVSQDHLDARRQQILDAARRCFVRDGFHVTSMQDVLGEANLSAGAVYRYFPSKDAIVAAIAADILATLTGAFEAALDIDTPPPLDEVLGLIFAALEGMDSTQDAARLAVQVWGEALRDPALAARVGETFARMRAALARLVAVYQERGLMTRDVSAERVARVLTGLVPGFMIQRALMGDVDAATFRDGMHALMTSTWPAAAPL